MNDLYPTEASGPVEIPTVHVVTHSDGASGLELTANDSSITLLQKEF